MTSIDKQFIEKLNKETGLNAQPCVERLNHLAVNGLHGLSVFRDDELIAIYLSPVCNTDPELYKQTMLHEYAHFMVRKKYGRLPDEHGKEFVEMAKSIGLDCGRRYPVKYLDILAAAGEESVKCSSCGQVRKIRNLIFRNCMFVCPTCGKESSFVEDTP